MKDEDYQFKVTMSGYDWLEERDSENKRIANEAWGLLTQGNCKHKEEPKNDLSDLMENYNEI